MPSTVGHLLAGVAAAWTADLLPRTTPRPPVRRPDTLFEKAGGGLTVTCALLAALPDADLLFGVHRTATHSVGALLLVTIVAAAVTGWVTSGKGRSWNINSTLDGRNSRERSSISRVALTCGAAHATHLLLDWLAIDRYPPAGIQLLWPFTDRWFISGLDLFPQVQRFHFFSAAAIRINAIAVAWECAALLPIVAALWLARRRRRSRSLDGSRSFSVRNARL